MEMKQEIERKNNKKFQQLFFILIKCNTGCFTTSDIKNYTTYNFTLLVRNWINNNFPY